MSYNEKLKILFLGDIAGKPGRLAVKKFLSEKDNTIDFVIANVENASHGFGLTEKNYNELSEIGIDCMTSGNHIWDKKDIFTYIDNAEKLIRPINYPDCIGKGFKIFETIKCKIGVINALGRSFMPIIDNPLPYLETAIAELKTETNIIFVDFHAEATAEKLCYAKYLSDKYEISIFTGTHTHVQTADEKIINNKTAYITDAGFCGDTNGIIGMDYQTSLKHLTTMLPAKFDVASSGKAAVNGILVSIDVVSGFAEAIERINTEINL